ncbi:proline-rich nuclear receptor coactivator 1 [Esox lucius]|uniref:Proline-rich nuclear receptor coactivator 1 n=1 Tax=Esox lucius TaxID=8010 RepID=A0A6Q2YVD3_ESOLU|nr:proline-rich nuclear receptor coactivator 1 [Esox lucius]
MLGDSLSNHIEPNLDNVENNNPSMLTSHHVGATLSKTRHVLLKKGGRQLRSSTSGLQRTHHQQPHQKQLRNNPSRLADINNNNVAASKPPVPSAELATNRAQTVLTLHHLKQGTKKELLKSKSGRLERTTPPGGQSVHNPSRHDQTAHNLNPRSQRNRHGIASGSAPSVKKNNSCHPKPPSAPFQLLCSEKPFNLADNVKTVNVSSAELAPEEELRDGEKIYAGAKFSEPPSPSVLPKPPSHWVGETAPQPSDHSREQMTFHLKSLLKVQDKP